MKTRTLRRLNNALHRDIGYLAVGMTIIYAISGIVLNHFKSGDFVHPDYSRSVEEYRVSLPAGGVTGKTYAMEILAQIGEQDAYKSYRAGQNYLQIFLKNGSVYVDLTSGNATLERKHNRYLIKEFNLLHYNNIKNFFTWFSDLYAIALMILAITGLFILRGRNGILGRGAWLTAAGIMIPALIILIYA
jgi:hypothetical protein